MEVLHAPDDAAQLAVLRSGIAAIDEMMIDSSEPVTSALLRRRGVLERRLDQASLERYLDRASGDGMAVRLAHVLGVEPDSIQVTPTGPQSGRFTVTAEGANALDVVDNQVGRALQLHQAHLRAANPAALQEATELLKAAVARTDPGRSEHFAYLGSLGLILRDLGIATDDQPAQDEALECLRVALQGASEFGPRPEMENNLAVALRDRYHRSGNVDDLTEGITLLRRATRTSDTRLRAQVLDNLGLTLRSRYLRRGDLADFNESVRALRRSVDVAAERDPDRSRYINDLAAILADLSDFPGARAHQEDVLTRYRQALGSNHPDTITAAASLAAWTDDHSYWSSRDGPPRETPSGPSLSLRVDADSKDPDEATGRVHEAGYHVPTPLRVHVRCDPDEIIPGRVARVWLQLGTADGGGLLAESVRLRVLLDAIPALVTPVSRVMLLAVDRTANPVEFEVALSDNIGLLPLVFRVYRESDSHLLIEVTAHLPVQRAKGQS